MSSRRARRHAPRSPGRRRALAAAVAALFAGLAWPARGHTPYRQWQVYRQRYLLIVASKTDPAAYRLCQALAETLASALPESQARPSRAPSLQRVASLVGTGQIDLALLSRMDAVALRDGRGVFADLAQPDLRALFGVGDHLLVCLAEFSEPHARILVETLDDHHEALPAGGGRVPRPDAAVLPPHAAVLAYLAERP